jgi:hypothetical protein
LEVLEREVGSERSTTKRLEKFVKGVGPETNNDVVLCGNIAEGSRDRGREGDLQ